MAEIIDATPQAEVQEEPQSTEATNALKISEEDRKDIISIANDIEKAHQMVGGLEVRKAKIIMDITNMEQVVDEKAKQSMLNAGISETDLEKYRINIQTGELIPRT